MRSVLVAVLGNTPAVLTEAFYYYAQRNNPTVIFKEIHVFTTTAGRKLAIAKLLGKRDGENHFYALLEHLGIPQTKVTFDENHIYVPRGPTGKELEDVRDSRDSLCMADQLCAFLQRLCEQDDIAVYASIAGGRKTMGLYLAAAMQLFGRRQDRLFHVLVDPRVEARRDLDFFFPVRPIRVKGKILKPDDIKIECHEVPLLFWPWNSPEDREKITTFSKFHERRQKELQWVTDPPALRIHIQKRTIALAEHKIKLPNVEFLYYCFFADLRRNHPSGTLSLMDFANFVAQQQSKDPAEQKKVQDSPLLLHWRRLERLFLVICPPSKGQETDFATRLQRDFEKRDAHTVALGILLSKIKNRIKAAVGSAIADWYIIENLKRSDPDSATEKAVYGICLPPEKIEILDPVQ